MDEPQSPLTEPTYADELGQLITAGHARAAMRRGRQIERHVETTLEWNTLSAAFYFQLALAISLCGKNPWMEIMKAQHFADYTKQMEIDFRRDTMLARIRTGHPDQARQGLVALQRDSVKDYNRHYAAVMTEGRILYGERRYKWALKRHLEAAVAWRQFGDSSNKVWEQNNLLHLYKAWAMCSFEPELVAPLGVTRQEIEQRLLADLNKQRTLTVMAARRGTWALQALDIAQTSWFRLQRYIP